MEDEMTLRQGLEKFHADNIQHLNHDNKGISKEAKSFFLSHDIAHVLFGCDISFFGEGSVKIWTMFGTTLGFWKHIRGYRKANAFQLSKKFNPLHVFKNIFKFLLHIPLLILRAKQMNKPWPWEDFEPYLDVSISEIRKEFNIKIVR